MKYDVPVQKGEIDSNPRTMKTTPYPERKAERREEMQEIRRGQTMDFVTPRQRKN